MESVTAIWQWLTSLFQWLFSINFQIIALAGGAWFSMFLIVQVYRFIISPFLGNLFSPSGVDDTAKKRKRGK